MKKFNFWDDIVCEIWTEIRYILHRHLKLKFWTGWYRPSWLIKLRDKEILFFNWRYETYIN